MKFSELPDLVQHEAAKCLARTINETVDFSNENRMAKAAEASRAIREAFIELYSVHNTST
ncbi:hypothetical protein [Erwinia aphidicola]|uniref:hypothetical protein n=1 Tax=Erwinia aphidicola TaxID=68334 RepID=UPI0030193DC2